MPHAIRTVGINQSGRDMAKCKNCGMVNLTWGKIMTDSGPAWRLFKDTRQHKCKSAQQLDREYMERMEYKKRKAIDETIRKALGEFKKTLK